MFVANYAKTVKPSHCCGGKGCVICGNGLVERKLLLISEQPLDKSHLAAQARLVDKGDAVRVTLSKELKND